MRSVYVLWKGRLHIIRYGRRGGFGGECVVLDRQNASKTCVASVSRKVSYRRRKKHKYGVCDLWLLTS